MLSRRILTTLFTATLLVSCGSQKTEEIDLSALQLIPKKDKKTTKEEVKEKVPQPVINNLKPLLKNDQVRESIIVGKDNPFAPLGSENNATLNNLKLTGFLLVNDSNYAFINYMGKSGSITSNSIGGVNTTLLPDGTRVKELNIKNKSLEVVIDNQSYEIFLD